MALLHIIGFSYTKFQVYCDPSVCLENSSRHCVLFLPYPPKGPTHMAQDYLKHDQVIYQEVAFNHFEAAISVFVLQKQIRTQLTELTESTELPVIANYYTLVKTQVHLREMLRLSKNEQRVMEQTCER
ncbi:hypothetical protein BGZ76_007503 [Entomortierella beljakovae]|nr:hypothetical protein BGZ76_007503 [Entomortierella beljakovae]